MPRSRAYGVFSLQPADTPYAGEVDEFRMDTSVADAPAPSSSTSSTGPSGASTLPAVTVPGRQSCGSRGTWLSSGCRPRFSDPVMSMKNHVHPWIGIGGKYSVLRVVPDGVTVQLIAADDIGAFATPVFADPTTHLGRVYELAGDQFTNAELSTKSTATTRAKPDLTRPKGILAAGSRTQAS